MIISTSETDPAPSLAEKIRGQKRAPVPRTRSSWTPTVQMTAFNDGIEAAARLAEQQAPAPTVKESLTVDGEGTGLDAECWRNTREAVERSLAPEWEAAVRDVLASGNYGWATMVAVAVKAIREQVTEARQELSAARAQAERAVEAVKVAEAVRDYFDAVDDGREDSAYRHLSAALTVYRASAPAESGPRLDGRYVNAV